MADTLLFQYVPLKGERDIRLLRLLPSAENGRIRGELEALCLDYLFSKDTEVTFQAMSYCWGDPTPVDMIWLTDTAFLPINASAADILHSLEPSQYVWIDSVCIDQNNNSEKSKQVAMMWHIYHHAQRVVAWLGGPEDNAHLAMEFLSHGREGVFFRTDMPSNADTVNRATFCYSSIIGQSADHWATGGTETQAVSLATKLVVKLVEHYPDRDNRIDVKAWEALKKLLDRPYFRRAWIYKKSLPQKKSRYGSQAILQNRQHGLTWSRPFTFLSILATSTSWKGPIL